MKAEIFRLRKKLSEQEKKLHSTVKHLHFTNQLKENMEKVIIDQCKCMQYYWFLFCSCSRWLPLKLQKQGSEYRHQFLMMCQSMQPPVIATDSLGYSLQISPGVLSWQR